MSSLESGAEEVLIESRVNSQGRVVIPAEVRRRLGLDGEGTIHFMVSEGEGVRIVTPAMLRYAMWANNTGGDGGDSSVDVRTMRDEDALSLLHDDVVDDDPRTDEELFEDLSRALEA
jgi:AbrB family looped-hinge helix DNA binding protein